MILRLLGLLTLAAVIGAASVTVSEAGGGGGCHAPLSEGSGDVVELRSRCFGPGILRAQSGQTVRWLNADDVPHNVVGTGGTWGVSDLFDFGQVYSQTFDTTGIFPYYCSLHPGMVGVVVVGDGSFPEGGASQLSPSADYVRQVVAAVERGNVESQAVVNTEGRVAGLNEGWLGLAALVGFVSGTGAIAIAKRRAPSGS